MKTIQTSLLRAFTMIELLVTMTIIMILAGLAFGAIIAFTDKADEAKIEAHLMKVDGGIRMYMADNNDQHPPLPVARLQNWPTTTADLKAFATNTSKDLKNVIWDDYLEGNIKVDDTANGVTGFMDPATGIIYDNDDETARNPLVYIGLARPFGDPSDPSFDTRSEYTDDYDWPAPAPGFNSTYELWTFGDDGLIEDLRPNVTSAGTDFDGDNVDDDNDNLTVTDWQ